MTEVLDKHPLMIGLQSRTELLIAEFGVSQKHLSFQSGFAPGTLATWWSRKNKLVDLASVLRFADTWLVTVEWLLGRAEEPRWNLDWRSAQTVMRDWIRVTDTEDMSPGERIRAIWNKASSLVPALREDVWATYLGWATFDPKSKRISYAKWTECRSGFKAPGDAQILGASRFTGIPTRWFDYGDRRWLTEMDSASLERLGGYLRELNLTPDAAASEIKANRNPR